MNYEFAIISGIIIGFLLSLSKDLLFTKKREYIILTVDMSLKNDYETIDDFITRVRRDNLGRWEIMKK